MNAGTVLAGRYQLEAPDPDAPGPGWWSGRDRHLDRVVTVVVAPERDSEAPLPPAMAAAIRMAQDDRGRRVLDGGVEDGRAFVVFERVPGDAAEAAVTPIGLDATGTVPVHVPPADDGRGLPLAKEVPGRSLYRRRAALRLTMLIFTAFGLGAGAVLAFGVLAAPDPRTSGAWSTVGAGPGPDAVPDALPSRTLPGAGTVPPSTMVPTTLPTTTMAPTTTTAAPGAAGATPTTTKPRATPTTKPKVTTTKATTTKGKGRDRNDGDDR